MTIQKNLILAFGDVVSTLHNIEKHLETISEEILMIRYTSDIYREQELEYSEMKVKPLGLALPKYESGEIAKALKKADSLFTTSEGE
jgi:hypothetical protein